VTTTNGTATELVQVADASPVSDYGENPTDAFGLPTVLTWTATEDRVVYARLMHPISGVGGNDVIYTLTLSGTLTNKVFLPLLIR
jgi:hypothetical protein